MQSIGSAPSSCSEIVAQGAAGNLPWSRLTPGEERRGEGTHGGAGGCGRTRVGSSLSSSQGLRGSEALPSAAVSPPNISPSAFSPCWGRKMDVEALPEGSRGRAWAAVGRASRAALGPWQGTRLQLLSLL